MFFYGKKRRINYPKSYRGRAESITRDSVIRIAEKLDIKVVERAIDRTELYTCDEAFLCGSAMGITPIISIDRYHITEGIGTITQSIRNIYFDAAVGKVEEFKEWITEII